jgi:hypothetical protein
VNVVARPIQLDKRAIGSFVQQGLMPQITRHAERHTRPDEPIGDTHGWASGQLDIEAADGRSSVTLDVEVGSQRSRAAFVAVLAGKTNPRGGVTLYLNGALTPADLLSESRQQPMWTCKHETCIAYGLYSLLIHEATHAAELAMGKKQHLDYSPSEVKERGEAAYGPYVNDASEVRAFLQQIVDEVTNHAGNETLREHFRGGPNPSRALVDAALSLSTTWSLIEKHLTSSNRVRILKAVYEALARGDLLNEKMAQLVAHRFIAKLR